MLSELEARRVKREFRPQFQDDTLFEKSWQRYFERAKGRERVEDLRQWLEHDLGRDALIGIGLERETVRTPADAFQLSSCWHCQGTARVRVELEPSQVGFGELQMCPACRAGQRRCGCAMCEPNDSQRLYDHSLCCDETGHDFLHPDSCQRCLGARVVQKKLPAGVDHVRVLAGGMSERVRNGQVRGAMVGKE